MDRAAAGFLISGIGVGLLNPVIADVALSVVPKEQSGMAAGINDTFRQVGIAVGIAAWGAIFLGAGASKTQEVAGGALDGDQAPEPGRGDLLRGAAAGGLGAAGGAQEVAANAAEQGFLHGLNEILVLGALLSFAGAVLALWLVRESDIERETLVDTAFEARAGAGQGLRLIGGGVRCPSPKARRAAGVDL